LTSEGKANPIKAPAETSANLSEAFMTTQSGENPKVGNKAASNILKYLL
jgi:hypothetical protein